MTGYDKGALQNRLGLFNELQRAAREITLPLFFEGPDAVNKAENGYDPVTQADMDAERRLRELISEAFPEDTIKGEEFDDIPGANDWSWTLDPIDGTRGFVAGVPVWSTLVAVSFQDTPLLGLIDLPALNTSFWGTPGKTWREGTHGGVTTLTTRKCAHLNDAVLGCTEPLAMLNAGELTAYNMIRSATRFSRLGLDAFGYGLVADGRMDIIIEAGMKPCDTRALIPVIEGAGGRITNWEGGPATDGGRIVAVGDPDLLPELHIYLSGVIAPSQGQDLLI